jgi:hypothetical protein
MAKKCDGVVEAVRYSPDGKVLLLRVYDKRGPTWSDRVLIDRDEMVRRLKGGCRYMVGTRVQYMAGTFETTGPVLLAGDSGCEVLVTSTVKATGADNLEGVPRF